VPNSDQRIERGLVEVGRVPIVKAQACDALHRECVRDIRVKAIAWSPEPATSTRDEEHRSPRAFVLGRVE
jgi:hypothetical protein